MTSDNRYLTPMQRAFVDATERIVIFGAELGAGKTFALDAIEDRLRREYTRFLACGPNTAC
jgi:predicted ATP-binding protein involved in virulence